MSSIFLKNDSLRLFQCVGNHQEELGYIESDPKTKTHVLWLKDPSEEKDGYIAGDEFSSLAAAKAEAPFSKAAEICHYLWLSQLKKEAQNRTVTPDPVPDPVPEPVPDASVATTPRLEIATEEVITEEFITEEVKEQLRFLKTRTVSRRWQVNSRGWGLWQWVQQWWTSLKGG